MASVNKVILIGNLGANPELKYLPSGQAVCEMRMATTDRWLDKQGQKQERTEWHRVVVYGKQGENCAQYLAKGRSAYIEGSLRTRSWDDKEGNKKYMTEVIADRVQFLGGGGAPGESGAPRPQVAQGGGGGGGGSLPAPAPGAGGPAYGGGGGSPPPMPDGPPPDFGGGGDDDIPF